MLILIYKLTKVNVYLAVIRLIVNYVSCFVSLTMKTVYYHVFTKMTGY